MNKEWMRNRSPLARIEWRDISGIWCYLHTITREEGRMNKTRRLRQSKNNIW